MVSKRFQDFAKNTLVGILATMATFGSIKAQDKISIKIEDYSKEYLMSKEKIKNKLSSKGLNKKQKNTLNYIMEASNNYDQKNYEEALEEADKAINLDPNYVFSHIIKAKSYGALYEKEREAYSSFGYRNHDFKWVQEHMDEAMTHKKKAGEHYQKKVEEYEKIAELNPNFKTNLAVADLSGCFCDEHECNTAIEYYTKAINSINQTIKKENDIWELMEMKNEKLLLFSKRAKEYRHIKDFEKAEKDSASFEKLNQEIKDFKTEKEKL